MEIQGTTPKEFVQSMTNEYREQMRDDVDTYYNEDYFETFDSPEELIRAKFPEHAWREYFIGCLPTNRQIHLVYEQGEAYGRDRDLLIGLGKQFRDEMKHTNVFANLLQRFTDDQFDLIDWNPPHYDQLVGQARAAVEWEEPQFVAAGFQMSTEIMAAFMIDNLADYLELYYPNVADALHEVSKDEGDHVHMGRLVAERFAEPDDFDQMEECASVKYEAARDVLESY